MENPVSLEKEAELKCACKLVEANEPLLNALVAKHAWPGMKWKTFVNPQRTDGLFVAEDLPIKPYGARGLYGEPLYPATPQEGRSVSFQLPHCVAEELVRRLNAAGSK